MTVRVSWPQALAWRLARHHLHPSVPGAPDAATVVRDLCGVQSQVASSADQAVRVRRAGSGSDGEVDAALADGRLIRTWAMRGTLHLLTPADGPAFLSLMAAGRPWARPSWQRYFGVTPDQVERMRELVREALLAGGPLTREELIAAVVAHEGHDHLGDALRSGWGTLLKPIAWQGDLCHGPMRGRNVTFQHPTQAARGWPGIPDPEEAAPVAIAAYLRAYGPAPLDAFSRWLAGGYFGRAQLKRWQAAMGDRIVPVSVDGEAAFVLAEDLDGLLATEPTDGLRLLPGFDQWVLGPGTDAAAIIDPARRTAVSRTAGWIAPVVLRGGRVTGTWSLDGASLTIDWFAEAGRAPSARALTAELKRWSAIAGRPLESVIGASPRP
jgi:hypothetical protein